MSVYQASFARTVLNKIEALYGEETLNDILDNLVDYGTGFGQPVEAPTILEAVVVEDDYHAAAHAFALTVKNRRAPMCKRFPTPCDPWATI